ncbi:MAG: hypothetical protein SO188_06975 [Prevotella sp.]|nr:hypothetical protein [Prevotella sp.]
MITLGDIRKGHPFGVSSSTDKDYADIANNLMPDFALNSNRGYARGRQLAQGNLDFLARTLRRHIINR